MKLIGIGERENRVKDYAIFNQIKGDPWIVALFVRDYHVVRWSFLSLLQVINWASEMSCNNHRSTFLAPYCRYFRQRARVTKASCVLTFTTSTHKLAPGGIHCCFNASSVFFTPMKKKNIDFQRITLVALLLTFVLCNMYNIILFFSKMNSKYW